jgi:hypothetical protein
MNGSVIVMPVSALRGREVQAMNESMIIVYNDEIGETPNDAVRVALSTGNVPTIIEPPASRRWLQARLPRGVKQVR